MHTVFPYSCCNVVEAFSASEALEKKPGCLSNGAGSRENSTGRNWSKLLCVVIVLWIIKVNLIELSQVEVVRKKCYVLLGLGLS